MDVITAQRTPQPRLAAIYLLMPTSQNVELVLRDHSTTPAASSSSRPSKKKDSGPPPPAGDGPKYASAYIHFVDGEPARLKRRGRSRELTVGRAGINDNLVERLTSGLPDNYLQALRELYTNFHGKLVPPQGARPELTLR